MQFVRFAEGSGWGIGLVTDGGVLSLSIGLTRLRDLGKLNGLSRSLLHTLCTDGKTLLLSWPSIQGALELMMEHDDGAAVVAGSLTDLRVAPFVPNPEKIVGVSYNYAALAAQEGVERAAVPIVFAKTPSSVAGAFDDIFVPPSLEKVDFEAELGVLVGAVTKRVETGVARSCIGAYTVINDLTAKLLPRPRLDLETITLPLKGIDNFAPLGAVVVTADELADFSSTRLRCRVNGEERQNFAVSGWAHDPAEVISYLSSFMTLQPGDLISMGTSRGIGVADVPPRLLHDGDVVEVQVGEYCGTRNTMRFRGTPNQGHP
jgi:2-keto-4-pentenoate hydratase/2-oxohepta-3-ene-1,7-dioic acid hydratase in catechol pathway